jgi:predicted nucleic acid-binding protein
MIFLDTSYLVAVALRRDALHQRAVAWSGILNGPFTTTEYVVWEFVNRLSTPPNREKAHTLLSSLRANPRVEVTPATPELFRSGLALHAERSDKSCSLTDCISFVVMRESDIRDALTHDQDFEQTGFNALLRRDPPTRTTALARPSALASAFVSLDHRVSPAVADGLVAGSPVLLVH